MAIPFHGSQYPGRGGHYESWFLRANDPGAARAFWIRYTQFIAADGRPPLGEIWAIWFDAERASPVAVKQEFPLADCRFDRREMNVELPTATLKSGALAGNAELGENRIAWDLGYEGDSAPILLLPRAFYDRSLPKAKSVTSRPQVRYRGTIKVNGETFEIDGWPGSENHNWGSKHTDEYAWGQVATFDEQPDAFFECITARLRVGPVMTPRLSIACLRLDGRDYVFNAPITALRAKGSYRYFSWQLETKHGGHRLRATIEAPADRFAGLTYYNPPAGQKTCLNSKLASCELEFRRAGGAPIRLRSRHGAAFEIFTDRSDHGIPLSV